MNADFQIIVFHFLGPTAKMPAMIWSFLGILWVSTLDLS